MAREGAYDGSKVVVDMPLEPDRGCRLDDVCDGAYEGLNEVVDHPLDGAPGVDKLVGAYEGSNEVVDHPLD